MRISAAPGTVDAKCIVQCTPESLFIQVLLAPLSGQGVTLCILLLYRTAEVAPMSENRGRVGQNQRERGG